MTRKMEERALRLSSAAGTKLHSSASLRCCRPWPNQQTVALGPETPRGRDALSLPRISAHLSCLHMHLFAN